MPSPEPANSVAPSGPATPDPSDWAALCRRVVEAQRRVFAEATSDAARRTYDGRGEGGDHSLVIDRLCEDAVFDELKALHQGGLDFTAISEERGEIAFGSGGELRVVVDPIDGSLNAKRFIPSHSLSIAVANGPSMAEVIFGYVYDFGASEEFAATLGGGATLNGVLLDPAHAGHGLEVVGVESAEPGWMLPALEALRGTAYRLRVIGSIAITMSYVAAARLDGMLTVRGCRSVDAAAGQLIAREAGAVVGFDCGPPEAALLDLSARYGATAARTAEGLEILAAAQRAAAGERE